MKGTQGAIHFDITGDETDLKRALASSRSAILASGDAAEQQGARIEQMFKRATTGAVAFFSVAKATDFVKSMATVHGEFQSIQIALNTILGSEDEATKLFEQLKDTAAKTPFDLKGVASGAKQLLAYGESADTVNDTLIKLGNIAAGLSQPLGDIVYLYGTTMTQGRLYTQDLNQFVGRGIPMIDKLAEHFGVAKSEVRKLVEEGKVGFPEVQVVINSLTQESGMFFNLMEKQSMSVTGRISDLEDKWSIALDEMGKSSEGFLYSGIEGATYLVEHYDKVLKILGTLIAAYGSYKAALIAINAIQRVQKTIEATRALLAKTQMLRRATQAQILFNQAVKANPYVLAFSALTTVITALALFSTKADKAAEAQAELNKNINDEVEKLDEVYKSIKKVKDGTEDRKRAIDTFNSEYGKYLSNLLSEKSTVEEIASAYAEAKRSVVDFQIAKAKSSFLEEPIDDLAKSTRKFYKQLGDWTKELDTTEQQARFTAYVDQILEEVKNGGSFSMDKIYDAFRAAQAKNSYQNIAAWRKAMRDGQESFGDSDLDIIDRVGGWDVNQIDFLGKSIQRLQGVLNDAESDFTQFSAVYSDIVNPKPEEDGGKKFKTFAKQVEAAKNRIVTLKQELKDLINHKNDGQVANYAQAIEDKRKEISQAEDAYAYLRGLDPKKKSSGSTSSTDYKTKIADEGREIERLYRDLELSIEKTIVDSKKEGLEKVLAQNELNHKMEIESIQRQKEDLLRKIQENERTIWESENPDWKKKGLTFKPTTTELPKDKIDQFDKLTIAANEKLIADNKRAIDEMLADFLTYEQSRTKITEEYEKKRKALYEADGKTLKKGVTQGNVDELNRNETEALNAVDEQFAQREETYQAWMDQIANMTLRGLEDALEQAKAALAEAEKSGVGGSKLAAAKAKVNTAEKKVKKARAENEVSPGKRTIKEWEDLYKTLNEVEKEFEGLGDTVGGVVGEIISECGKFASSSLSMINGIVQLTQMSATGIQGTATAGATAISTLKKASVILTIISAAMQIAMTIINLFNNDEEYQKEIEKLQRRIDQLKWELDNAEAVRMQKNVGDILERVKRIYVETRAEVLKLHAAEIRRGGFFARLLSETTYKNDILAKSADKLAKAYANIEYTADKALGAAKYDEAKEKLQNIAQQQLLIQEQIKKEDAKKKTDHGKIEDWERQIVELGEEANKIINEIVEDIIGGSASDIAKELADAFFDAFQAGEDAAEAWGAKVNDIVADVIRRMLIQKFLEEPLGKIFNDYKSKWFKDGDLKENGGIDAIMESMNGFANDLNQVGEDFQTIWDNLPDSIKNLITVDEESREASERGIATASQESVDENNGRLTVIQSHTYTMNENVKTLVLLSDKMLEAMVAIRTNTEYCRKLDKLDKLDNIDKEITQMKRRLDDFGDNGLKMK